MGYLYRNVAWAIVFASCGLLLAGCAGGEEESLPADSASSSTRSDETVQREETSSEPTNDEAGDGGGRYDPADRDEALAFAEAVKANVLVARLDRQTILVWDAGRTIEVETSPMQSIYSDGSFLYQWVGEGGATAQGALLQATASTLDGVMICEADGRIHHVTERADGSYVMAVQRDVDSEQDLESAEEFAYPMDAIDCQTGDRQAIEPVTFFTNDGEYRFIERVAGRVFTGYGDAEGNANVVNEDGISVNGEDYAGYHTFNEDASMVVYGDMEAGAGPHFSDVTIARDTELGEQLSTMQFDALFQSIHFIGDRLLVTFPEASEEPPDGTGITDRALVLDPTNGERLDEVKVGFELIYVG